MGVATNIRSSEEGSGVEITALTQVFGSGLVALEDVNLTIEKGEFLTIVGPSGCGKSTMLRIIAGLTSASSGNCHLEGQSTPVFVFQEPALLPWRTAIRNAELILELEDHPPAERREIARQSLELVGLKGFEDVYPHGLSGGMRMRLSLARAITVNPEVLLLDEPLAAVDELTREVLQEELLALWQRQRFTAVLVTHNVLEAVFLSTSVAVMSARPGRIVEKIEVPFPYPREADLRLTPEFTSVCAKVTYALRHK